MNVFGTKSSKFSNTLAEKQRDGGGSTTSRWHSFPAIPAAAAAAAAGGTERCLCTTTA